VKNWFQSLPFKRNLHRYTGEAARVAAAVATPAFMSDLQDFGIVTTPEEAAGFRAFVVESEEAPEDIRVARGAAAAAAAVEALQDYVAAAKEAAALNLEGTTGTTPGEASNRASATYSATESPAAAAAAAVAAADASHVAEDYVGALVEACAAVEPAGRLERCYPQFVTRCTELIAEQRRWDKVGCG
jgi:hypothetical protein